MVNLVGTVLQKGKYEIEQALGQGGFGITYRAVRLPLNQVVVIKTLNEAGWSSHNLSEQQLQFQEEARRLAQCRHPNIVNVTDFFIEAGSPYLVMDYIPGRPLSEMVTPHQPLPEETAVYYTLQIADALQTVHRQSLLHRDVKPQNIMVHDLTGEAILIDFGIARELTVGKTQTHTSIVSDGYAPLEQYLPKARRSEATDVYGLAATLYFLVTGEIPVASVLRSHHPLTPPRQLRPHLSPHLEQAILQGMALELADRPQSMATWQTLLKDPRASHHFAQSRQSQSRQSQSRPNQSRPNHSRQSNSTVATQVVAPGYPGYLPAPRTNPATVAVDLPPLPRQRRSRQRAQGPGLFSSLTTLITLALLTGAAMGGYQLYQRTTQTLDAIKQQPILKVELPPLPDFSSWGTAIQDALKNSDTSTSDPATAETATDADTTATEKSSTDETETHDNTGLLSRLPMLLKNSGLQHGQNSEPTDPGSNPPATTAIPGFSPGTAASQILKRLGEPTRQAIQADFKTAVYDLIPDQATVAYVYDQANGRVQQVEAAFAPSFDRLMMRVALVGMLNGDSTKAIESGLESVRTQQQQSYHFEHGQFTGSIERNQNGYIHIYVRPRDK